MRTDPPSTVLHGEPEQAVEIQARALRQPRRRARPCQDRAGYGCQQDGDERASRQRACQWRRALSLSA